MFGSPGRKGTSEKSTSSVNDWPGLRGSANLKSFGKDSVGADNTTGSPLAFILRFRSPSSEKLIARVCIDLDVVLTKEITSLPFSRRAFSEVIVQSIL